MRLPLPTRSGDRGRRRRAATATACLLAAAIGGCVGPRGEARSRPGLPSAAPDPFDLTGLAPAIDADRSAAIRRGPPAVAARPDRPAGRAPGDVSPARATARPAAPPSPGRDASPDVGTSAPAPSPSPTAGATPPTIPLSAPPFPIDLSTSLRLADAENPTIAEARVAILDALAQQQAARALLLPSLNAGTNYHGHDGNLQRSSGRILRLSEQSLYVGGGARTLAAETVGVPAVSILSPLTEAIYEPLAARQRVAGARLDAAATANSILLEVADLFLELLGVEAELESRRLSAAQADEIVRIVADYNATGQGRKADADRAVADRRMLQGEIQRTEEDVAVASARLSRRLNLDPSVRLQTLTGPLATLCLVEPSAPAEALIRTALARRPDLGARAARVALSAYKLKEEQARPLLPTVWVGFSGGALGGGSNLVPPLLAHFAGRTDFDVRAYWTLLNLGAGNSALIRRRRAEVGQAEAERARVFNAVRDEVTSARALALTQRNQVEVARAELATAEEGFRGDFARLRETIGLPIEALDSLKLLAQARLNLIEAIIRTNRAQFALFVALGSPPPIDPSAPSPATPPPIATPLGSPITWPRPEPAPPVAPPGPPLLGR